MEIDVMEFARVVDSPDDEAFNVASSEPVLTAATTCD